MRRLWELLDGYGLAERVELIGPEELARNAVRVKEFSSSAEHEGRCRAERGGLRRRAARG